MNKHNQGGSLISSIMEAVGLGSRKKLNRGGVRYLGMSGAFGKGKIRHCSTWDFEYKLPRPVGRSQHNDFNLR